MSSQSLTKRLSSSSYNDFKAWVLLTLTMEKHAKRTKGGTVHKLCLDNPRYQRLPLSSHRSADCFVLCYTTDGTLDLQVRISLLSCLDSQLNNQDCAIPKCTTLHSNSVCTINKRSCATFRPSSGKARCIHQAESDCQWVM